MAVSYGWEKFTQHWQAFILLVLGVWAASIVVGLVAFGMSALVADSGAFLGFVVWALSFALVFVVAFAVQAGVYRAGLGVTQGREPSFSMFTDGTNLGEYILTIIVVGLGAFVGFLLCVIPGIIWLFFVAYAPLRALDKGEGPGDAIRGSIEMVRENVGQVLLILLVSYLIYIVGAMLCYVGLLVSIPVALVTICWSYRVILREPIAP